MRGDALVGAILGAAFVAACYSDGFRSTCKQAFDGIGTQVHKQISGLVAELKGDNAKEQRNDDGQAAISV